MNAVEVRELRKEFHRRKSPPTAALAGVSFTIARGECVAILGQNGSGKSTLVRLLSTLLLVDGGSARVFGHDVEREEGAVRRLVNRVSVEASFFKRMSARADPAPSPHSLSPSTSARPRAPTPPPRRSSTGSGPRRRASACRRSSGA